MKSVAFIIPGFKHSPKREEYLRIGTFFEEKNITPQYVTVPWKNTVISANTDRFVKQVKSIDSDKKYVLGFSFGAMIAFLAATQVNFDGIILCSLSPYFQEDLPTLRKSWIESIGKRRFKDFQKIENASLVKKITAKTFMLYGTKEGKEIEKRAKETFQNLDCEKELIEIDGVRHNIADEYYLEKIRAVARQVD